MSDTRRMDRAGRDGRADGGGGGARRARVRRLRHRRRTARAWRRGSRGDRRGRGARRRRPRPDGRHPGAGRGVLDEALGALAPGGVVMVMATVGPAPSPLGERLGGARRRLVDAPVRGGVARAAEGDLVVLVSGDDAAVERAAGRCSTRSPASAPDGRRRAGRRPEGQARQPAARPACTSPPPPRRSPSPRRWASTPPRAARWSATAPPPRSCSTTAAQRMVDGDFDDPKSALDIFVKDMGLVNEAAREHVVPGPARRRRRAALPRGPPCRPRPARRRLRDPRPAGPEPDRRRPA